jgi:hypothetical protein
MRRITASVNPDGGSTSWIRAISPATWRKFSLEPNDGRILDTPPFLSIIMSGIG